MGNCYSASKKERREVPKSETHEFLPNLKSIASSIELDLVITISNIKVKNVPEVKINILMKFQEK